MMAERIGRELDGCAWVGVPCAGGMSEVARITARSLVVADLHRHVINLATVVSDPSMCFQLRRRLHRTIFHPDVLEHAQSRCRLREAAHAGGLFGTAPDPNAFDRVAWAYDYFICCWMGQGGRGGTPGEFTGPLSVRWDAGGGDSAKRFTSARDSLRLWQRVLSRATFQVMDCFDFLAKAKDRDGHGIYIDPPWVGPGDGYSHPFTDAQQRRLAVELGRYEHTRIVIRHGDHPLIRELYPSPRWTWIERVGRTQSNGDLKEVLILNGPSLARSEAA